MSSRVLVYWDKEAVEEFGAYKEPRARKAILSIVDILSQTGAQITEPHAKKVRIANKLYELRPGGGKILARPLYARVEESTFVVLAIAPEADEDPKGFETAVERARERAERYGIQSP